MSESVEKSLKIYKLIKLPVFLICGVLLFIFSEVFLENEYHLLPFLVGGVITFYGIEGIIMMTIKGEIKEEPVMFMNASVTLILGVIVLFFTTGSENMLVIVSVLWSVWAIMRESEEISEKVLPNLNFKITSAINLLESVAVILFSVLLIITPVEHHVHSHIILLGIELILEVTWPLFIKLEKKLNAKN